MRTFAQRRAGMTILEVVLALGILAVGMATVVSLLAFGAALSGAAERRAAAVAALDAVLPALEERLFPLEEDGKAGEPQTFADRPVPGFPGLEHSVRAELLPSPAGAAVELWRVDVTLHWRTGGARTDLTHTTVLPRAVPYGERIRQRVLGGGGEAAPLPATAGASRPTPSR